MYEASDPRAALAQPAATLAGRPQASEFAAADYLKSYQMPPAEQDASAKSWCGRGQNFLVAYTRAEPGATLRRSAQPDEYAILLPNRASEVVVQAGDQTQTIEGHRIVFVPPGASRVDVIKGGQIVRLFSARAHDIAALCANAAAYAAPQPNTAPLEPWPAGSSPA